jgi:hypothetical protein
VSVFLSEILEPSARCADQSSFTVQILSLGVGEGGQCMGRLHRMNTSRHVHSFWHTAIMRRT